MLRARRLTALPMATVRLAAIARKAPAVAVAVLVASTIGLPQCRADGAVGAFGAAIASGRSGCDRDRSSGLSAAAGSHGAHGAPLDGRVIAAMPVWKTIALGTPSGTQALRAALNRACRVGDLAVEILDRPAFITSKTRTRIDLVVLSAAELGFAGRDAPRAAIYERAKRLGLTLCPAEVGPQLRLQYPDQPRGEFLHVAMEPISTPSTDHAAFVVGNGDAGLLLIGENARSEHTASSRARFVFVRAR